MKSFLLIVYHKTDIHEMSCLILHTKKNDREYTVQIGRTGITILPKIECRTVNIKKYVYNITIYSMFILLGKAVVEIPAH